MKRKVLSLALALVLTLGVSVPAFAAPSPVYTNALTSPNGQATITNVLYRDGWRVVVGEGAVLTTTVEYEFEYTRIFDVVVENGKIVDYELGGLLEYHFVPGEEWVFSANTGVFGLANLTGDFSTIVALDSATVASGTGNTTAAAPTAADAPITTTAAPSSSNYVATTPLNVRSGAGMSNDVIGGYKTGHPINVIEQVNRWWYKVQYTDSTVGYVSTLFVTGFDPAYYAAQNPDVVAALGSSYEALYGHYVRHGKSEGRAPYAGWTP